MVSKRGSIRHVEINVSDFERSKAFYHDFLGWLGYKQIVGGKDYAGWGNGEAEIFVTYLERYKGSGFHRRQVGLNHIAFQAKSKADVNRLHSEFLVPRSIKVLYGGPKEYPEYRKGYYSVYFEDPDRIKLEFVHGAG
jgi:catechol 2,3-dioxygenase-like lactoylglutathione lyase family enzyme